MKNFADSIVDWQQLYGRHNLPWQNTKDPYRIWLSEIMLQQTQVVTVIPYYLRFLEKFPDIEKLASASEENVLSLWVGLGYYARARNLHYCSKIISSNWGGKFPKNSKEIQSLPGIGRSTAAAIASFAYDERAPILDGNVKRVFARHFNIDDDIRNKNCEKKLWKLAEEQIEKSPNLNMTNYTQGLIDLGAILCKPKNPDCFRCPISATCVANHEGRQKELPKPTIRKKLPDKTIGIIAAKYKSQFFIEKRPSSGIWGGLWNLPEFSLSISPLIKAQSFGLIADKYFELDSLTHSFSHFRLFIYPIYLNVLKIQSKTLENNYCWLSKKQLTSIAMPLLIKKFLINLFKNTPDI
ncbi:MAG: A/G-specific adenine glycosylase [Bordetella sp.]|nr:MAG: A/G-specific adenine glycosylase [Bordetella sp.]